MEVRFVDTTLRDGSQSLWASGLRIGMAQAVAEDIERAGFHAVEAPISGTYFKKLVRDQKEDPWEMARLVAEKMPNTVKTAMANAGLHPFEAPPPRAILELFYRRITEIGALNRVQVTANTTDQVRRVFPWLIPMLRGLGLQIVVALSYSLSPRHTDAYYAEKTRQVLSFKPDAVYLKDQGGLLTPERARLLLPGMLEAAGETPMELHSHCTTGLADLVYMEALKLGVRILHTGIPPLAEGSAQPSLFNVAANAKLLGFAPQIDQAPLRAASQRLMDIARTEGLPIGAPSRYEYAQYVHQVPGGVISNLKSQLAEMGLLERFDEVLAEIVEVRKDMGYPIMITPHSQFVVTQAAINVALGERYKLVIDELILFAMGTYGEDSGAPWMDQNLKDRLCAMPRAKELAALGDAPRAEMGLDEIRRALGGPGLSDEELLLRYIMKGESEIKAMRAAGPPRQYLGASRPLVALIGDLAKHQGLSHLRLQRGADWIELRNRSRA